MLKFWPVLLLYAAWAVLIIAAPTTAAPRVQIVNGTLEGVHSDQYNQDFFLGIRYAQPPVGELRYQVALAPNTSFDGVVDAKEYSLFCVGYGSDSDGHPQSEDCLALNVVKPTSIAKGTLLPVATWIHGGGLTNGASSRPQYNLSDFVRISEENGTPVIGVSLNYRVAGFGFLASKEVLDAGVTNLGLRDQRLALAWLQDNIAAFGGDPKKVTIWGESAGGLSVGAHVTGFGGKTDGLFRGVIAESGGPYWYGSHRTVEDYEPFYQTLVTNTGCSGAADTLACLRTVPLSTLNITLRAQESVWSFPLIDGIVFKDFPSNTLPRGEFAKVPLLIGANSDEGTAFTRQGVNTTQQFKEFVSAPGLGTTLPNSTTDGVTILYPNDPKHDIPLPFVLPTDPGALGFQYKRAATYTGDFVMIAPRRASCQTWAAFDIPVFCYQFDTKPPDLPPSIGVTHFQEVAFVFFNIVGRGPDTTFVGAPPRYEDLAREMASRWIAFVVNGDPNVHGRPTWPDYKLGTEEIVFAGNVSESFTKKDDYRFAGMKFINDHASEYHR